MDILNRFVKWEEQAGLYEDTISGFYYWYYIRLNIFRLISGDSVSSTSQQYHFTNINAFTQLVKAFFHNSVYRIKPHKADILVIACPRRIKKDDKYVAIYTDYLAERLKENVYEVEYGFHGTHMQPVYGREPEWIDRLQLIPAMKRVIHNFFIRKCSSETVDKARFISREITKEFDISISTEEIEGLIEKNYITYKYKRKDVENFLKRVSPKLIIYEDHYNQDKMIINEIAKYNEIRTVELQHGLLSNHIAYTYSSKALGKTLPDEIWLWGDFWKEICRLDISSVKKLSMGYPYFEKEYADNPPQEHKMVTVVFLSCCLDELIGFTENLARIISETKLKIKILYKLHPLEMDMDMNKWNKLLCYKDIVEVINTRDVSIYNLFSKADAQVSMQSTAIYEGLAYNLHTYIIDSEYMNFHDDIIQSGIAEVVLTPEQLVEHLTESNQPKKKEDFRSIFFEYNSLKKMKDRIDSLCISVDENTFSSAQNGGNNESWSKSYR